MATSVAATGDNDHPPLRRDSLPVIDLRLLSQSELYSLSLSSDSFDLSRCDDVVIPKINRAVFNESAGSRKQTYSRLRLASAESSSSTTKTTTLHRRTPHLRLSHTATSNNINDPEQAENSLIIRMLKQLCKSDGNFQDVDQIEDENINNNSVEPEFLNPETLGIKRKRGRPRKHENAVFIRPPTSKRIRHNTAKKVVVYDNERDRGAVNDRGVTVNMATLAGLEDPYGSEIRRRTVGMSTEDALLEFLRGLNGQWGSRRKKRRVVDASELGDALPKGWKLSLCIKKKEGRVWLFCRRYLSPSGRQFESCKEIATYLISIIGRENLDKQNDVNVNTSDDLASKGGSENASDLVQRDDIKRVSHADNPSSSSPPPLPTNREEQVTLDAMEVQAGGFFKCVKCLMIFDGKDELFDHQVLTHGTERSQLGATSTEWLVLEGGVFDCQICHESFSEKNQYNNHIGCHVKNEIEKTEPVLAPAGELDPDPAYDAHSGDKLELASPCIDHKGSTHEESDTYELVHDLNIASHTKQDGHINADRKELCDKLEESCGKLEENDIKTDEAFRTDQAPDVAVSESELFGEVPLSITESERNTETSGENHVNIVDDKSGYNLDQGIHSESELLSSFRKDDIGMCATDQVLNQDVVSDTGITYVDTIHEKSECILEKGVGKDTVGVGVLDPASTETLPLKSSICEDKGFSANIDVHFNGTSDELISENEKVVCESSSGFFLGHFGLDKDGATVDKKLSTKATHSLVSPSIDSVKTVNSETLVSSQKQESPQKGGFGYDVNKHSSGFESSRLDMHFDVETDVFGSYGASDMEGVSTFEEESQFQNRPSVSLWQEEESEDRNLRNDVSFHTMEEPRVQINSENVIATPSNKAEEAKLDDFQIFTSNEAKHGESVASLCNNHTELSRDVLDFNTKSNLEFCSLVPSESEQAFGFQDDVSSLYDRAMEECKHESSERGLLNHFSIADTPDDIFENKIYSTQLDIGSNELSLAFGNPHSLYPNTMRVDQKKDLDGAFDVHTNLSMVNNSMIDDLKIGRRSAGRAVNLSGNVKTSGFQNSGNAGYPDRAWEGFRMDESKNSENKFTTGFRSNHGQTHADVVPSGIWRTNDGNQLRSGISSSSHAQIPSPSSFHSFNIMPEKAGDGQFRINDRYNEGFGVSGLRSNRPEPVEFSFLTGRSQHNPHPLEEDSRVFSYNTEMEQQFDSSFWLGKNAMMPNASESGRNQITSVCTWCRNEFHLQSVHSVTQDGIGSLCPSCSAGMSGHVNFL